MVLVFALAAGLMAVIWAAAAAVLRTRDEPGHITQAEGGGERSPSPDSTDSTEGSDRRKGNRDERPPGSRVDVESFADEVARLRELPLKRALHTRVTSPKALGDKVAELGFDETDPEEMRETERLLVALRLALPSTDLAAVSERLYREQVLGLYVPKERTLYVRRGDRDSPLQRITTAHEIVHALQDQSFNLVRLERRTGDDTEAAAALLALIEGDAVLTQQLWALQYLSEEEQQRAMRESAGGSEALDDAPDYLRASLFFPYQQGGQFVAELYRNGGFSAVNDAFSNPPTTTEQIMHPERYLDRDEPQSVRVRHRPGEGWERAATYPLGEFDVQQMLKPLGDGTANAAAQGWDGGEIRSWQRGNETLVAAAMVFDSTNDAAEACDGLRRWYVEVADAAETDEDVYAGDRDHMALQCSGDRVRFGLAPTAPAARAAIAG